MHMDWVLVLSVAASIIVFGLIGLTLWASAEVPLIWREIALNTRTRGGSDYKSVQVLSAVIKLLAVLSWVLGLTGIGVSIAVNMSQGSPL